MKNVANSNQMETAPQSALEELTEAQIEAVVGGALLLPAVQKARDAASRPVETMSLNF